MRIVESRWRLMLSALMLTTLLGACGNGGSNGDDGGGAGGESFEVSAVDFEFDPSELEVPEGEVTVNFTNNGTVDHTFTLEEDASVDTGSVAPGQSKTITFTAPTEETDFICTIHYESHDMEGRIGPA